MLINVSKLEDFGYYVNRDYEYPDGSKGIQIQGTTPASRVIVKAVQEIAEERELTIKQGDKLVSVICETLLVCSVEQCTEA